MFCSWNVRGAGKKRFVKVVFDLRRFGHFDVLAILEPRINGITATKIVDRLGFNKNFIVETSDFSRGI